MIPLNLALWIAIFVGLFLSMVVHELCHAAAAYWFGDDTAKRQGRITLDPLVHIDPMMTIIVPGVLLFISGGTIAFGGAKPVPVDPRRLKNPRHDLMWIAAAGPISNLLLAVLAALSLNGLRLVDRWDPIFAERIGQVIFALVQLNVLLALFNLLPIPPLDGSKVLAAFLPDSLADSYLDFGAYGMFVVAFLVMSGGLTGLAVYVERITFWLLRTCLF